MCRNDIVFKFINLALNLASFQFYDFMFAMAIEQF